MSLRQTFAALLSARTLLAVALVGVAGLLLAPVDWLHWWSGDAVHAQSPATLPPAPHSPQAAAPAATAADVVQAYPAAEPALPALREELQRRFATARVVVDSRLKQLVVIAPPGVQAQIARFLADKAPPRQPVEGPQPLPVAPVSRALRHIQPDELAAALQHVWGANIHLASTSDARQTEVRYPTNSPDHAVFRIDRTAAQVQFVGRGGQAAAWERVVASLDQPRQPDRATSLVPAPHADPGGVRVVLAALQREGQPAPGAQPAAAQPAAQEPPAGQPPPAEPAPGAGLDEGGLIGEVQIEFLEGLDVIVIRGEKKDVERVTRLIEEIERQSQQTRPEIEIYPLQHVDGRAMTDLVAQINDQVFAARQGRVTITPLIKPNALLLIGRKEALDPLKELLAKLDQPVPPQTQSRVFQLKYLSAVDAERTVRNFFVQRPGFGTDERLGLGTRVRVIADYRSNSLIVQASPRDLAEVGALLRSLDVESAAAVNQVRIFKLRNALADDLAPVLQEAITGQARGGGAGLGNVLQGGGQAAISGQGTGAGAAGGTTTTQTTRRSTSLQFLRIDAEGKHLLESGILGDMTIVPDGRGNALVVTGPARSMDLMEALIRQLDDLPASEAQIKVFTIVNGDATALATMLQQLFGQAAQGNQGFGGGGAAQLALQTAAGAGESTLVPLRFSVNQRTNSIVASGNAGDLAVVHKILVRLDEGDIRERITTVYRLQNAPAFDVSQALNQLLQGRRQINQLESQLTSPFEQIEREVIVVPEIVSNSLIVSATPRYYDEVRKIVEDLDRRPPMVVIQVLIAEVNLDNIDELGVELGLQDSLLFDRGIGTVGFPFNNLPLGNNTTPESLETREKTLGQALSSFNVGRTSSALGYGGLVLSASSESVSVLIRALQDSRKLQVISRPQVQTLDNQPAFVQVGSRVPYITQSNILQGGTIQNTTTFQNVGILLGVTPRTSPDGLIVMEINAEKSEVGPEAEGIPISISPTGEVVRQPQIRITTAQTTVSARSGQTVILGGLITTSRNSITRRVPYLGDVPILGRLFRYDGLEQRRRELLIIMTPAIIRTDEQVDWLNARESERMSWCLSDVINVHGEVPLGGNGLHWDQQASPLIFPDEAPSAPGPTPAPPPQGIPAPAGNPPLPPQSPAILPPQQPPLLPPPQLPPPGEQPDQSSSRRGPRPAPAPVMVTPVTLPTPANSPR